MAAVFALDDIAWVHAHTVPLALASFAFFLSLTGLSMALSPAVWPVAYATLPAAGRLDWHGRLVGGVFACCAVGAAFPEYWQPGTAIVADHDFGSTPRSHGTICMAVGYFGWDVLFCLAQHRTIEPAVLAHALAVFVLYACCLQPFMQVTACFFLCWEASTPLLNLRAQLIACKRTEGAFFTAVSVGFAALFLGVRLGCGLPGSAKWWGESLTLLARHHAGTADPRYRPAVTYYALAANVLLNSLNLFWAYKILSGLARLAGGGGAAGSGKKKKLVSSARPVPAQKQA